MFKLGAIILLLLCNICIITSISREEFQQKLKGINFNDVKADIAQMLTDSKPEWPADYGHYGPFFIRLAWHCAGSYRQSDGRGGCDGGRQRFEPERSWDDNVNLDKARSLLLPIKEKYGLGLSWGDLIILAGTTAIQSMGGPVLGFCAGRIDEDDGTDSLYLGPTAEQQIIDPCPVNGQCKAPLGATTLGLIYVNPEGPMGQPIPEDSAKDVRDTFGRMSMNDEETVALIGGGHAFGKAHGACPLGPGKKPYEDPVHPWQGPCGGDGKGANTFTSGFEGPWTTNPLVFDNSYFSNLLNNKWEVQKGPGGHYQWNASCKLKKKCPFAPKAHGKGTQDIMMLTSDISLTRDLEYLAIVRKYATDPLLFANNFEKAWYKLVTRDMGPITRCVGDDVPPAQPFQYPLPPPPAVQPYWNLVRSSIMEAMYRQSEILPADVKGMKPYYGGWFVKLAWQCASTFRNSDYLGGCNGARIRFFPQKGWEENAAMNLVLGVLQNVKNEYGDKLTWADLIVIAGNTALEDISGVSFDFCGGRSDATDGAGSEFLNMMTYPNKLAAFKDKMKLLGLTPREMVALSGRIRSAESQKSLGYHGSWMDNQNWTWGNQYFKLLLNETWVPINEYEYQSKNQTDVYMMDTDLLLLYDAPLLAIVQEFASDATEFMKQFQSAWAKVMNADRFDGPSGNVCNEKKITSIA